MHAKLAAIFMKDVQTAASYRLGFAFQFAGPVFMILSFFFLSRLIQEASLSGLQRYGGDYFSFVLVGIAFATYSGIFLSTVVTTIRTGQTLGTLELVLTSRTSLSTYLVGSSLYALLRGLVVILILLLLGALAFGVDFRGANVGAAVLVLVLSMAVMVGLGIISGSFILIYKQGDPISLLVNSGAFLLSGVAYPVAVLPGWLQFGSWALPHTYALEALRMALLQGEPISQIGQQLVALLLFGVVILAAGLMFFRHAIHRTRVEGSLAQY